MSLFWRFYIPFFVLYTGKRRAARASRHRGNGGGSATLLLPFGLDSTTAPGVVARSAAGSFRTPHLKKETSHKTPGDASWYPSVAGALLFSRVGKCLREEFEELRQRLLGAFGLPSSRRATFN